MHESDYFIRKFGDLFSDVNTVALMQASLSWHSKFYRVKTTTTKKKQLISSRVSVFLAALRFISRHVHQCQISHLVPRCKKKHTLRRMSVSDWANIDFNHDRKSKHLIIKLTKSSNHSIFLILHFNIRFYKSISHFIFCILKQTNSISYN